MAKKLAAYVHVTGENGQRVVLEPGQDLPEEFADQVGDHALEGGDGEVSVADAPVAGPGQAADTSDEALAKARKAEASRRSREAKAAEKAEKAAAEQAAAEQAEAERKAAEEAEAARKAAEAEAAKQGGQS